MHRLIESSNTRRQARQEKRHETKRPLKATQVSMLSHIHVHLTVTSCSMCMLYTLLVDIPTDHTFIFARAHNKLEGPCSRLTRLQKDSPTCNPNRTTVVMPNQLCSEYILGTGLGVARLCESKTALTFILTILSRRICSSRV